jgi:ATP synthase protein I
MQVHDVRILRGAAIPTAIAAVILAVVSAIVAGQKGLIGSILASVIVGAFFTVGMFVIARAGRISPQVMMQVAILSYMVKIALLFGFVVAFANATWFNPKAFAASLVASTLVWMGAQIRAFSKEKILYVDPHQTTR